MPFASLSHLIRFHKGVEPLKVEDTHSFEFMSQIIMSVCLMNRYAFAII